MIILWCLFLQSVYCTCLVSPSGFLIRIVQTHNLPLGMLLKHQCIPTRPQTDSSTMDMLLSSVFYEMIFEPFLFVIWATI
jgi:hypothetical protein